MFLINILLVNILPKMNNLVIVSNGVLLKKLDRTKDIAYPKMLGVINGGEKILDLIFLIFVGIGVEKLY